MSKLIKIQYIIFPVVFLLACVRDENPVPIVRESFWIYNIESDPEYTQLLVQNNSLYVTGGYLDNGIIIYRYKTEGTVDDFLAFDRTCPNEADTCIMKIDKNDFFKAVCSCCGSEFNIIGNYMEKGPAKYPLRRFKCDFIDGDLHIYY